uniref:Uncharacterized protein n=1 Tax=Cacopsylla melanoneura TaxID=428564 RepID=A0A8D8UQU2_9HEMI
MSDSSVNLLIYSEGLVSNFVFSRSPFYTTYVFTLVQGIRTYIPLLISLNLPPNYLYYLISKGSLIRLESNPVGLFFSRYQNLAAQSLLLVPKSYLVPLSSFYIVFIFSYHLHSSFYSSTFGSLS